MHKALILSPEHAEDALAAISRMAELCAAQSDMCRTLADELDLTGEVPIPQLRKLASLQLEASKLRKSLRNMSAVSRE